MKAIEQFRIGCFYMWGGQMPDWDKIGLLARQFPRMKELVASQKRPFIYRIESTGIIRLVRAWNGQDAQSAVNDEAAAG